MFDPTKDGRWARLELLGPGKDDRRSLVIDKAPGIEVRIGRVEGSAVYELKVPLQIDDGHPYAIGARPGATIGVGLETPDVEKSEGGTGFGMPGMGGLSLLAKQRERACLARCVLVSAYLNDEVRQQARSLGVDRVLQKPVDVGILRAVLADLLPGEGARPAAPRSRPCLAAR